MSRIDLPGYGIETEPKGEPVPACPECGDDYVPLDDFGRCSTCAPTEDETCEAYMDRMRAQREAK